MLGFIGFRVGWWVTGLGNGWPWGLLSSWMKAGVVYGDVFDLFCSIPPRLLCL